MASASPSAPPRPPRETFLVFGAPLIEEPDVAEVLAALKSGWLGTIPKAAASKKQSASYQGVAAAAPLSSSAAAPHLSILAAGIGPGDEVVMTPMTCCATENTN